MHRFPYIQTEMYCVFITKKIKISLPYRSLYCIVICSSTKVEGHQLDIVRYSEKYYSFHDAREQMATITKKELIDRIAEKTQAKRIVVKRIVQSFLDEIIDDLAQNNRLEFRDFGVFETRTRAARVAQNPKTLERVQVPAKRTIKFKMGRLMKQKLTEPVPAVDSDG